MAIDIVLRILAFWLIYVALGHFAGSDMKKHAALAFNSLAAILMAFIVGCIIAALVAPCVFFFRWIGGGL